MTSKEIILTPRKGRSVWCVLAGLAFLGTIPLAWLIRDYVAAPDEAKFWVCGFRTITSRPCPLCGLTRAFAHVTQGQFDLAFQRNPAWPVAMGIVVLLGASLLVDGLNGTDIFGKIGKKVNPYWWYIIAAALAFGVLRVIFGWH